MQRPTLILSGDLLLRSRNFRAFRQEHYQVLKEYYERALHHFHKQFSLKDWIYFAYSQTSINGF